MSTYTLSQSLLNLRQALQRYVWWLNLSLVLVVATLVVYRAVSMPVESAPARSSAAQTLPVRPAQQAVFDYMWAHSSQEPILPPAATFEPAQQSVVNYLLAHDRVDQSPSFWNQAAQAVRAYLRVHSR